VKRGDCLLIVVDLAVGETTVGVDRRMYEAIADPDTLAADPVPAPPMVSPAITWWDLREPHGLDQSVPTPVHAAGLYGISCPSVSRCWAIGTMGHSPQPTAGRGCGISPSMRSFRRSPARPSKTASLRPTGSASARRTRARSTSPLTGAGCGVARSWVPNVVLWGVSCPDASECLAVGSDSEGAVVLASFDGGRHCSVQAIPGMPPSVAYETVQCTAPRHCVVLGRGSVAALAVSSQAGGRVAAACRRA